MKEPGHISQRSGENTSPEALSRLTLDKGQQGEGLPLSLAQDMPGLIIFRGTYGAYCLGISYLLGVNHKRSRYFAINNLIIQHWG